MPYENASDFPRAAVRELYLQLWLAIRAQIEPTHRTMAAEDRLQDVCRRFEVGEATADEVRSALGEVRVAYLAEKSRLDRAAAKGARP